MLDKLRKLRTNHLKIQHDVVFYPYQEAVSDRILEALLQNLRLTHNATEEEIKKLKLIELPVEFSRQCFHGETIVKTIDGYKAIEDIKVGDKVLSYGDKAEYKKVTWKNKYSLDTCPKPMIYWSYNGEKIRCTYDHPFFYKGKYVPVYKLAWGKMAASQRQKLKLLCKQYGQTFNDPSSWWIQDGGDETSQGRKWIFKNSSRRQNRKNAPISRSNMDTQPKESADNQSYKSQQSRQSCGKFGVVDSKRQHTAQSQSREGSQQTRRELWNPQTNQRASFSYTEKQKIYKRIINRVRGKLQYYMADSPQIKLDKHLITVEQISPSEDTYAITVEDNHNYFVTKQDLLVKNSGKTTAIVYTVEFIMTWLPVYFGRQIHIGIFAPQIEQAKTDFDRLKVALRKVKDMVVVDDKTEKIIKEQENAKTLVLPDGSSCYIAPITKTSRPESKTLDLMIFEESQDIDDKILKESIWPIGSSTNAPRIYIGTAGTRLCYFRTLGLEEGALKLYFEDIVAQRREIYERTGESKHLIYEQTVRQEIEKHGEDSDEIQRPYFGKWLIGTGQFTTQEEIEAMETDRKLTYHYKQSECYIGIDTAKHPDSTVVTVLRYNADIGKKEIINWLELNRDNYQWQFDLIKDFLSKYNVVAIAIDSTGQGDFMPDMFEAHTEFADENSGLYRVKFSAVSKDNMYKNLKVSIKELLTTLPDLSSNMGRKFKQQMLDLQQEYKGQLLSVSHPDDANARDDFPDSFALAEWAYAKYNENNNAAIYTIKDEKKRNVVHDAKGNIEDYWPGLDD